MLNNVILFSMTQCDFEDLANAVPVMIHLKTCGHYTKHEPTETTKWHEVDDYEQAESLAEKISKKYNKGWRKAKCCIK